MNYCKKCNSEVQSNYCPNCGHPQKLERINGHYIVSEIGSELNFEKGIFYTVKELLIKPGQSVREFISEDRNRLVKPIMFILVCSFIYALSVRFFHFEDGYNFNVWQNSAIGIIFKWISENYGYTNILMAIFIAIWIKLFYRKFDYNYYEILILLCFVIGIEILIISFWGILESITNLQLLNFGKNIAFIYAFWAIGQFFDKRKIMNYLKAIFSYFLGMITFGVIAVTLGILIDLVK